MANRQNNIAFVGCVAPTIKAMLNGTGGDSIPYYELIVGCNEVISNKHRCTFIRTEDFQIPHHRQALSLAASKRKPYELKTLIN
jgi:hypothetical protein